MSRLDSFIRRLEAQRACLDLATTLIDDVPGPVLELGLGNGRTYDHLRERLPDRDIFVFDRRVAAHPACTPPPDRLILGDLRQTLATATRFRGRVALAHMDVASGDVPASLALARELAPHLAELMRPDGIVVSEPPLTVAGWTPLALPDGIAPGRYHLYRAGR